MRKISINKKSFFIFLLIVPHLKPESFEYVFSALDFLFNIGRVISVIVITMMYAKTGKRVSKFTRIVFTLQMWIFITTIINNGDIKRAAMSLISTMSLILIVEFFIADSIKVVNTLMVIFELLIYVNLATIVLFPDGLYQQGVHSEFIDYFLGFKNAFIPYCLIAILIACFYRIYENKSMRSYALIIACVLSVIISKSITSSVALILTLILVVYSFFDNKSKIFEVFSLGRIYIISIIVNILFVFLGFLSRSSFLNSFITNVLGKEMAMGARQMIWSISSVMISEKPLIGYGIGEHVRYAGYVWHGHNKYIQLMLEGGIPSLLIFIILIYLIIVKLKKVKKSTSYKVVISVMCGFLISIITESGTSIVYYLLLLIAYNVDVLEKFENYKLKKGNA